jgi:regulator of chromosome condensation
LGNDRYECKKPFELNIFRELKLKIYKLECGSMHSLALCTDGSLYSWGCNDDFALGRDSESKNSIP